MPPRPIHRTVQSLDNGVRLQAIEANCACHVKKHKGRHWVASFPTPDGGKVTIGEYTSYQQSHYERQTKAWGRGGGHNSTHMVRSSWVWPATAEQGDEKRLFNAWRDALRALGPEELAQASGGPATVRKIRKGA